MKMFATTKRPGTSIDYGNICFDCTVALLELEVKILGFLQFRDAFPSFLIEWYN
jgi:hypothetical protein